MNWHIRWRQNAFEAFDAVGKRTLPPAASAASFARAVVFDLDSRIGDITGKLWGELLPDLAVALDVLREIELRRSVRD